MVGLAFLGVGVWLRARYPDESSGSGEYLSTALLWYFNVQHIQIRICVINKKINHSICLYLRGVCADSGWHSDANHSDHRRPWRMHYQDLLFGNGEMYHMPALPSNPHQATIT